jgi:hypothetical protein
VAEEVFEVRINSRQADEAGGFEGGEVGVEGHGL